MRKSGIISMRRAAVKFLAAGAVSAAVACQLAVAGPAAAGS